MIKHVSLDHSGGWYHFRIHDSKLNYLCKNLLGLRNYLYKVFEECPHDYFQEGPRGSALRFNLKTKLYQINGHEISILTRNGLMLNQTRYQTDHSKVQVFLLENDDKTVAMEVPIWLEPEELEDFNKIFNSELPLTGHVDVLRIEDDKIWVWDYKPGAYNEKFAATQVYFYALMLSKRTGIPLDQFRCGYFDSFYSFIFKPGDCKIDMGLLSKFL